MNKVFVNGGKRKSNNGKFRLRNFGSNKPDLHADNDARTEYFPYSGGNGEDEYTYQDRHLNYEPADIMQDSHVELEEPNGLGQQIRRVLVRGSKYDVYEAIPSTSSPSPESSGNNTPLATVNSSTNLLSGVPPELTPLGQRQRGAAFNNKRANTDRADRVASNASVPSSTISASDSSDIPEFWTFQWLNSLPATVDDVVPLIRQAARESVILAPVDMCADIVDQHVAGSEVIFAGIELFLMMLIADFLSRIVHIACSPAVLVTKLAWKLLF